LSFVHIAVSREIEILQYVQSS